MEAAIGGAHMLEALKLAVYEANMLLPQYGLITFTWGNASGIDRARGLMVIKPSGVAYEQLRPEDMVIVSLETGAVLEGGLAPSSDTPTHLALYKSFPQIGGVVHTHSPYATSWAQAESGIPCYGTTHADYFYGAIPCARPLTADEITHHYEENTGLVIAETFQKRGLDPLAIPAVLVSKHGPFTWGKTPQKAAENAAVLEEVAKMALRTTAIQPDMPPAAQELLDKHYYRKHGEHAYYGQR